MYRLRHVPLISLLVLCSCNRSPQQLVERGNQLAAENKTEDASLQYRKALQADPQNAAALYQLARLEQNANRHREAFALFSRAVDRDPANRDAKVRLADTALLLYRDDPRSKVFYQRAQSVAAELLRQDAGNPDGLRIQAYLQLLDGKAHEAAALFAQLHLRRPNDPGITLGWADALIRDQRGTEAESELRQLLQAQPGFAPAYERLYSYYIAQQKLDQAEAVLKAKADALPRSAEVLLQLAQHYTARQQPEQAAAALRRLLDRPGDFPHAWLQAGDFQVRQGHLAEARALYEEGLRRDTGPKQVYEKRLANALMGLGQKEESLRLVQSLRKELAADEELQLMEAALLLDSPRPEHLEQAISAYQSLAKQRSSDPAMPYRLGNAYRRKGDKEAAKLQYREAARRSPGYDAALIALAELYQAEGKYAEALRFTDELLAAFADNPVLLNLRGSLLRASGREAEARVVLSRATGTPFAKRESELQVGLLNIKDGRLGEADAVFRRYYSPGQQDLRPLAGLVEVAFAQDQPDRALRLLQEELPKAAKPDEVRLALAASAARAKRYPLAIEQLTVLAGQQPGRADLQLRLGEMYGQMGQQDRALASLRRAAQLGARDAALQVAVGLQMEARGEPQEAQAAYERALALDSKSLLALNNLAYLLAEQGGNLDQALEYAQRATRLRPENPAVSDTLGYVYLKRRQPQQAAALFRRVVAQDPKAVTYRVHLAMALLQGGDRTGAQKELRVAQAQNPTAADAELIRRLTADGQ